MYVCGCEYGGQRPTLWSRFCLSTLSWVSGIWVRSADFHGKPLPAETAHLYYNPFRKEILSMVPTEHLEQIQEGKLDRFQKTLTKFAIICQNIAGLSCKMSPNSCCFASCLPSGKGCRLRPAATEAWESLSRGAEEVTAWGGKQGSQLCFQ